MSDFITSLLGDISSDRVEAEKMRQNPDYANQMARLKAQIAKSSVPDNAMDEILNALKGRDHSIFAAEMRLRERKAMEQIAANALARKYSGVEPDETGSIEMSAMDTLNFLKQKLMMNADQAIDEYELPIWGRNYNSNGAFERTRREIERQRKERDRRLLIQDSTKNRVHNIRQDAIPGDDLYAPMGVTSLGRRR